jgi:hypothetical protein
MGLLQPGLKISGNLRISPPKTHDGFQSSAGLIPFPVEKPTLMVPEGVFERKPARRN